MLDTRPPVQRRELGTASSAPDALSDPLGSDHLADASAIAARGTQGASSPLPHLDRIQESFGRHDVTDVKASIGGATAEAATALGAHAYASGNSVGFRASPDLHTAAHEAAHTVQQRQGVQLKGATGQAGDSYERHADAVADKVVAGESAESLLDQGGDSSGSSAGAVQLIRFGDVDYVTGEAHKTKKQWRTDALEAIQGMPGYDKARDSRLVSVLVNQNIHIKTAEELWATIHPAQRAYHNKLMKSESKMTKLGSVTREEEALEASVQYLRGRFGVDDEADEAPPEAADGVKHRRHLNIGRKSNTFPIADARGKEALGVLKASKWTEAVNDAFIEGGIDAGNTFVVHTELPDEVIEALEAGDGPEFERIVREKGDTMVDPDLTDVPEEDQQAVIDADPWTALWDTRSKDLTTFAKEVLQILAGGYVLE